jgi:hypothetical protein
MDDRWFRLLSYWQDHEFKHSLTFPFLIGALRKPIGTTKGYENTGRKELEDLVDSVRSHAASNSILYVYRCGDRDKLVLTRVHGTSAPPYSVAIPQASDAKRPVLFAYDSSSVKSAAPVDSLVAAIWHEGGTAIEHGLFSCRGRMFQPFDDYELNVIRAALA